MKSKSFKEFVAMQESKKPYLVEMSQYKKARPEEYEVYNEAYKRARSEVQAAHNKGIKGYMNLNYMSIENIMKQAENDKSVQFPELPFEEAQKKARDIEARNKRIQGGNATHEDYVSITNELYGRR